MPLHFPPSFLPSFRLSAPSLTVVGCEANLPVALPPSAPHGALTRDQLGRRRSLPTARRAAADVAFSLDLSVLSLSMPKECEYGWISPKLFPRALKDSWKILRFGLACFFFLVATCPVKSVRFRRPTQRCNGNGRKGPRLGVGSGPYFTPHVDARFPQRADDSVRGPRDKANE